MYMYSVVFGIFFFKQKTAYEMRISDWSSDVCSSDLEQADHVVAFVGAGGPDLGAVHPPAAVDLAGPRAARGKIRAGIRFAHADAEMGFAPDEIGRASCRERVWQYV